ncbi:MAG TPA: LamG domain-containing protein [Blastocatellia bacterium]|nr:LamG domain-containing protein [Blastocatellia bacterium]
MANNDKDLVLYLPLDNIRSGGAVQDASDFANHGAVQKNVTMVADDTFGSCLSLNIPNPAGDHIIVPIKGLGTGNQPHTIEGWICPNGLPPSSRSWPLLLGQAGQGSHHWLLSSAGTVFLGMWSGTAFEPKIDKDKWTHIAMVHDGKQLSCYLNGILQGTPKNATFNLTSTQLIIARGEKAGGEPKGEFDFSGKIANLRIYRRALSKAEIQRDISIDQLSLKDRLLYLPLDEIRSGGAVQDASDFANHGAVKGNATVVPDDTFGGCLSLNVPKPVGDHITVPIKGLPKGNRAHTIEGWIYPNGYPPSVRSWPLLLGQVGQGSHHWLLHSDGTTNLGMWLGTTFGPKIDKDKWTHIAMVHDGKQLSCYVNGTLQGTPKDATFNLTSTDLTIAKAQKGGVTGEFDFSGKIANLRIYGRALSQAEIQRDIGVDQISLVAFSKSHPIDFSVYDDDDQPVLYISDDAEDHNLNLELRNSSTQAIQFTNGQNAVASDSNHHFALRFRPGTLSDSSLNSLINPQERAKILKEADQWDLYFPTKPPAANETASLYLLYKGLSKSFQPDERRSLTLQGLSAAPGSGARGTQVELIPRQLTAAGDDATPITGSRSQFLHITNHGGKKNIPLHVGFANGNNVLNDSESTNTLQLRITNVSKDDAITLNPKSSNAPSKFIVSFDTQIEPGTKEWALVSSNDSQKVTVSVDGRKITAETIEGKTPVLRITKESETLVWPITFDAPFSLAAGNHIRVDLTDIKSSLPSGYANIYVRYENIPGYWDGQFVCQVEKGPMVSKNGKLGIGTADPQYQLDVKSKSAIKLGLESNGGGQLVIANEPNDNKIYLEAFSSNGQGHASEFLLTGKDGQSVPKLTLRADATQVSGKGITLGLQGNGGGQLVVTNSPNDNKIYLEAFSSDGQGHAAEFLLTGKGGDPAPKLTLKATTTEISGNLNLSSTGTVTFPQGCKVTGVPIIAMKKIVVTGTAGSSLLESTSAEFPVKVLSAEAVISSVTFHYSATGGVSHAKLVIVSEYQTAVVRNFSGKTVNLTVRAGRNYEGIGTPADQKITVDVLVIAVLESAVPGV